MDWLALFRAGRKQGVDEKTGMQEPDFTWSQEQRQVQWPSLYMLPQDIQELNRLDFQHYLLRYALKANFLAPVEHPLSILDVGCGSGRWVSEIAKTFPQTRVIGIDKHLPPASTSSIAFPANCTFQQQNILEGVSFRNGAFDFVHQRLLLHGIPAVRWPFVLQELIRVTRRAGWIEIVDVDLISHSLGPQTARLATTIEQMKRQSGSDPALPLRLGETLEAAGLQHVVTRTISLPIGQWGGRLGSMMKQDLAALMRSTKPIFIDRVGLAPAEYDLLVHESLQEYEQYHSFTNFYVAYGQKVV